MRLGRWIVAGLVCAGLGLAGGAVDSQDKGEGPQGGMTPEH